MLWSQGVRYRIHDKTVFGTPDVSIQKKKLAVFVDGCFWHGCRKCYKEPKTNTVFWRKKLEYNRQRRLKVRHELKEKGWNMLEFWYCEDLFDFWCSNIYNLWRIVVVQHYKDEKMTTSKTDTDV